MSELPAARRVNTKYVRISDLAVEAGFVPSGRSIRMAHGGEKEGQCGNRIPRCLPFRASLRTTIYGYREMDSERQFRIFPRYIASYSLACSWAPSANGRMSHSVANVVLVEQGPRSRKRLCNISCHRPSHRSASPHPRTVVVDAIIDERGNVVRRAQSAGTRC